MACDVIVVGAGPAGSLTAAILARAGARVRLFDRARFPRAKLCGDTLNPGALRLLAEHMPLATIEQRGLALDGMVLTGPSAEVTGTYHRGQQARALPRRDLDQLLLERAIGAGAEFEDAVRVSAPARDATRGVVNGVVLSRADGREVTEQAALVIAADGRASRLARAAGLARFAASPRRWAIGGYFEGVEGLTRRGEMHIRAGYYLGVAPMPGGLANCCLVLSRDAQRSGWNDPVTALTAVVRGDRQLRERFARARLVAAPDVLGPMAVDAHAPAMPGMLLAGDAAGFIDPLTGDGLRFALAGAVLAAGVAGEVLEGALDPQASVAALSARRRQAFASKWRFNRAIRSLVSHPAAVATAAQAARVFPFAFERMIQYAGDCE